ncbi:glutamine transport system permease protein [Enterococcus sp. PF1-24]|uniref:amino acid ABC transporter substrate-binding protein/permease n=1 Tax=unclassified Enterococcus TaxID=2608891 RepID=UPI0024744ED8|nr:MULTISPECIES: amino acid ABC transporter substrate-binding protein/permease [unclassified Enterococcus]MDH6363210.1 glutamine transport system permease protein [Enterococcus sp. PFB1-1]MDH6400304.1 glutamine transport system permease protein [Enterococcus sp. PF1-24]
MKNKYLAGKLMAILIVMLAFFTSQPVHAEENTTYKIGTDLTFAPFEFQNSDGEYIGIDIDLLNAIAEAEDFNIELKALGFDSSIQGVQANQLDGMIAGMSITEERKKTFDFSEAYFDSGLQMAVKSDNTTINNYQDLKDQTVGAKVGTESATFLENNQAKYGYSIKLYDAADALYGAINNDTVVAIFDDYPVLGYAITNGQNLKLVGEPETGSSYGFAVKKGENQELLVKFNAGLADLKASGKYDEIVAKYISSGTTTTTSKKTKPQATGKNYKIGTDLTFAPFEFQNQSGEYIGIDIDLLTAIAENQGFTFELRPLGFDSSIQGVQAKQLDGMIAGMSITEERKNTFDFSASYFDSGLQMAVKSDNTSVSTYEDLKDQAVGAKVGTESAAFLEENQEQYGYSIKLYDAADALYGAIDNGTVVAIFDDYPVLGYAITNGQNLKLVSEPETGSSYGFAVKKGENAELLALFDAGLAELKASGEYDEILARYISTGEENAVTAEAAAKTVDESTLTGLIKNNYKALLNGLWKTILLSLVSFLLALVIGVIFGLFSVSPIKALRGLATVYVDVIRGIPMMVLAFFIFFGLPGILPFTIPDFVAGVITLTLNASAYIAEIVRGGINAVPVGQMEASRSLGLSYNRTMQKIILPQAIKIMIPSFVNQFVISLKDTTIISSIGVIELLQTGKIIVARTTQSTQVYFIIAVMYLILITALTKLAKVLEKKVK